MPQRSHRSQIGLESKSSFAVWHNGRVQRAGVIDSTQVKTADRGLRLQPFVIRIIVQAGVLKAIHDISRLSRCESLRRGKSSHRLHRMDDTPIDRLLQQRRPHEQYHQLPVKESDVMHRSTIGKSSERHDSTMLLQSELTANVLHLDRAYQVRYRSVLEMESPNTQQ